MPARHRRRIPAAVTVALLVLALLALLAGCGGSGSKSTSSDPALRSTANRFLQQLNHPLTRLPVADSSLNSFKAWVYDTQPIFARLAAHPGKLFEQVQFVDPSPFPPQAVTITSPGHAAIYPANADYNRITTSRQPYFTTVQSQGKSFRVYEALLQVPSILQQVGIYAILEVGEQG